MVGSFNGQLLWHRKDGQGIQWPERTGSVHCTQLPPKTTGSMRTSSALSLSTAILPAPCLHLPDTQFLESSPIHDLCSASLTLETVTETEGCVQYPDLLFPSTAKSSNLSWARGQPSSGN